MQNIDLYAWCFLSGRICALENKLLRKDFFEHLLLIPSSLVKGDSGGFGIPPASGGGVALPLLSCLKESPLREDFLTPEDVLNFEEILHRRLSRLLQEVKELSPEPWVWELFQTRYDLINLKNFLKEKLIGLKRPSPSFALGGLPPFPSNYNDETWEALWEGCEATFTYGSIAPSLPSLPLTGMYLMALYNLKGHLKEVSKSPGLLDIIVDATYLSYIPQLVKKIASPFIVDYYLEYQKLVGILFIWRSEQFPPQADWSLKMKDLQRYIPGFTLPLNGGATEGDWEKAFKKLLPERILSKSEITSPLLKYERAVEDTLMETLEDARFFVFGPERVFGYLKGLETETFNLRLAIGGRLQSIPSEDIHRRLRKSYV